MKLTEITETKFLTGKAAERWIEKNLKIDSNSNNGAYQINANGDWDISGDTVLLSTNEFKVKIRKIVGNLECRSLSIKTLKGFPDVVTGFVDVSNTGIKSFEGMPKCRSINAQGCGRIKSMDAIFPFIQGPLETLDISGCNVNNLIGIAEMSKFPIKKFWLDVDVPSPPGALGVVLMKGLEKFCEPENYKSMAKPWRLIYDCFQNEDKIFQSQADLIDGGWEDMAEL